MVLLELALTLPTTNAHSLDAESGAAYLELGVLSQAPSRFPNRGPTPMFAHKAMNEATITIL